MFLTDRKLERRIQELEQYRYRDIIPLKYFDTAEDNQGAVNPKLPPFSEGASCGEWKTIETGDAWVGRDKYLWLHREILIPAEWKGKKIVGVFDFGTTGAGNNSGFESMLYVNGSMYQGVDANHKEAFLDDSLCGTSVSLTFRLWSGLEGGGAPKEQEHRIARADLAWLDEKADDFHYLASMVWQTIQVLEEGNPVQHELRKALDSACHCIDWSAPGSELFYESLHQADDCLNESIDGMDKNSLINVYCVGHTHIDVAWLWRLKHTREKCSRSFSTVFRLMELYPEYIFLQTQPQLYEYMKQEFPEIYEMICQKVKEGRWEADGGMWVEADCNLTSGESLTRQILLGSKFIKDEFGKEVEYLWLPDVFGYSWALPQILKKAGIHTFMTTKISWNQYNRMPHDTFWWKGIDGSEILTHFITTPEPWNEPGSWFYTYNGKLLPSTVKGVWDQYSEKQMNKDLLISFGFGDGGGGVNRDMLEYRRRMDKIPGLPNLKISGAGEYFRRLHNTVEHTDQYVHTWDGELYLEYHRGTYTSQGYNKRMNRKMELLYRKTEWMAVMAALQKGSLAEGKQEELTKGWKHILTNQFHDIIPGSSIHEVYEDSRKDYALIEKIARNVEKDAKEAILEQKEHVYTVCNDSGWKLDQVVTVPETSDGIFRDGGGEILVSQKGQGVTYVEVKNVPPMGMKTIVFEPQSQDAPKAVFSVHGREIDTPYYQISINQYGQMAKLFDKTYGRDVLPKGQRGNVLQVFEDKPLDNDAWDIDIFYQEKMREITELTVFEITEMGPLAMRIHMEWEYMNSRIRQDLILYSKSRRIDFCTHVDFREQHQLLKAAFPVDVRATYGTYDVQYGNVRRPNHWNTSWDQAKFETVAHRWADLSERNYGVSLLNDCKYGHDIKDNVMRISLLRAGTHPDHLQDQGEHVFTYALLPHQGDFVEGSAVQEAFALNEPMEVIPGKSLLSYESFLAFDNDQVELDAVKQSEDGKYLVIRFHEFAGSRQTAAVKLGIPWKAWAESDLRERPFGAFTEDEIQLTLHAYEIKTILVEVS
ncbi:MAG: alpha-mannosidase [Lachnospiraceae bacterium]|nr:alpha-mannosidase [Lachnospiraceae bacterium]